MNEGTQDQAEGKTKEIGGKVEQGAGKILGDNELMGRGQADEAEGTGQGVLGKVKDAVGNATDKVKGAADSLGDKAKD